MRKYLVISALSLFVINFAAAQTPKTAAQYYNDGIKLEDQKKYPEALLAYKKAIGLNPNYKEALYNAGWCSIELAKYTEALSLLQKAKTLWPNEAKVYLELIGGRQTAFSFDGTSTSEKTATKNGDIGAGARIPRPGVRRSVREGCRNA